MLTLWTQGPSKAYHPFIVDNFFGSVESGILSGGLDRNGALLVDSEESAELLSMSDYGKTQYHNSKGELDLMAERGRLCLELGANT